jgi:hypothetical protein
MTKLEHSTRIEDMISADYDLTDLADSCCTIGFDNDGSTGFEIFKHGFELAIKAEGRQIFYGETEGQYWFFIGESEDEVLKRLELGQVGILETRVVRDEENGCDVWCARFRASEVANGEVSLRARQAAFRLCPCPWGTEDDPQALPSSYLGEGWWDCGNAH